jgi:hypothetical protein
MGAVTVLAKSAFRNSQIVKFAHGRDIPGQTRNIPHLLGGFVMRLSLQACILAALLSVGCDSISGASDIRYSVTGPNTTRVSLTYESGSGTSQNSSAAVPWSYSFKAEKDEFLYVSAQIVQGTGPITVTIYDEENVVSTQVATGFAAIATASGSN